MPRERNTDYQRQAIDITAKCKNGNWKIYVIAAEGDKTEYYYFQELINQYSIRLTRRNIHLEYVDRKESGDSAPTSVSQNLQDFYDALKNKYDIQNYDEFWMIIDTDDYKNRKKQIQELTKLCNTNKNFKIGLSNPCFELWLILHFEDADSQFCKGNNPQKCKTNKKRQVKQSTIRESIENEGIKGRPQLCKKILDKIHPDKGKSNYYKEFIKGKYIAAAIERSRKLGNCDPTEENFPQKIGTTVYQLLEQFPELSEASD